LYYAAAAATAIAGILHLMLGPGNLGFNVNQGIIAYEIRKKRMLAAGRTAPEKSKSSRKQTSILVGIAVALVLIGLSPCH